MFSWQTFREFNVSEIIEGGSLGHGTPVLTNYDIDLVLYSRGKSTNTIIALY